MGQFPNDVEFLKGLFCKNNFSATLIDKYLALFLNKIYNPTDFTVVPKKRIFIPFPYLGYISDKMKNEIGQIVTNMYPHLNLNLIFKNSFNINSFFKHKESLSPALRSSIIYKYDCEDCDASYIGSTKRQFSVRMAEHRGRSVRTGKPISSAHNSSIFNHAMNNNHPVKEENFKIINNSHNHFDLRLIEAMEIKRAKTTLNENLPVELFVLSL